MCFNKHKKQQYSAGQIFIAEFPIKLPELWIMESCRTSILNLFCPLLQTPLLANDLTRHSKNFSVHLQPKGSILFPPYNLWQKLNRLVAEEILELLCITHTSTSIDTAGSRKPVNRAAYGWMRHAGLGP
jgi:hypothetical protein